ncbi:glycoside hydrolase family 3 protein [Vibrio astriarenae]|uniref:Glycoside hydrolase family 3 protein n=1 Tax=Vibrio astriarenae TaxID=1481923 RepID=A0A7Z2T2T4_9VIBR|nr:glycoside hydrolase family 3 protein [Vibrio astriarenae]
MTKKSLLAVAIASALALSGCNNSSSNTPPASGDFEMPYFNDWPQIQSNIPVDSAIEAEIVTILSQMTLEEKVGQMIQPDLRDVTPEEVAEYHLGSLLNGGGGWPNDDKYASAKDWADEADKYWLANEQYWATRNIRIPFIWATDAVHGHNNVFKATVFPHNIGLGAARNPDLIEQIGQATAQEIVATGLDWTFAPTVATPRDYRWGRVYEGYSEDPSIVYAYASRMVKGLQGDSADLKTDHKVISNVKHWVGDGGTKDGEDRGENHYSEEYLRNIHAAGYFSGLEAGAQVVMTSFNSWHNEVNYDYENSEDYNYKLHGSRYMVTDVLKDKMGFDGLVVTDWNGHQEINGCTSSNCPAVVNAGNDILMVTSRSDWQAMYLNIIAQVQDGTISMSRIDDAVTRILRVKMRANLWEKPQPSMRTFAGDQSQLGKDEHRDLARQAVSESLVLLKNNDDILPLKKDQNVLIAGSAIDDITKQTGGWSLTWQGDGNTIEDDFPGATTMKMAIEEVVGSDNVITELSDATDDTVAIVVIGEDPYAEMFGDIKANQTLEFATIKSSYAADLETIKSLKAAGLKVVTVFYSGRPLYVNEEINHSEAFVAAWLPGTEAGGITDVIFEGGNDFKGTLSYSWPLLKCSTSINAVPENLSDRWVTPETEQDINGENVPLFAFGYGLNYAEGAPSEYEFDLDNLPLDPREYGCGMGAPDDGVATINLEIFGKDSSNQFVPRISGNGNGWVGLEVASDGATVIEGIEVDRINKDHQRDAVNITFTGAQPSQFYLQTEDEKTVDMNAYLNADSTLQFDVRTHTTIDDDFVLSMHCEWPCLGEVNIAAAMPAPSDSWTTLKLPLTCFEDSGMSFPMLNTAFLLYSDGGKEEMELDIANVRFVPRSLDSAEDELDCNNLQAPVNPPLDMTSSDILEAPWNSVVEANEYNTNDWGPIGETHATISETDGIIRVSFEKDSPEAYKAEINFIAEEAQNLSLYQESGAIEFELYVHNYGSPVGDDNPNTQGLSVKILASSVATNDYQLGQTAYPEGQWHSVSIPFAQLLSGGSFDIERVTAPFVVFPEWGASQAGVDFEVRNIMIIK